MSAELRAAWATALSDLEAKARHKKDEQVKAVAGVSAGVMTTAVVATAALACVVQ